MDELPPGSYEVLRRELPGIALVQVMHYTGPEALAKARAVAPHVNAILLDSGNPTLTLKELGGTGRVHNWEISRAIRDEIDVPMYLAGGLKSENVAAAVQAVRPFGVEVCSGVRSNGALDEAKLHAFAAAVGP